MSCIEATTNDLDPDFRRHAGKTAGNPPSRLCDLLTAFRQCLLSQAEAFHETLSAKRPKSPIDRLPKFHNTAPGLGR
jgi:hypothetical protein